MMKLIWLIAFIVGCLLNLATSSMLPYGPGYDTNTGINCDDCAVGFSLPVPLNFFNVQYNAFYISSNGVISFNGGVTQYTPVAFPITNVPSICPYWGDMDFRSGGTVWYRIVTPGDPVENTKVRNVFAESIIATLNVVVTWDNVGYFSRKTDKLNTVQCEIISDGFKTYVFFNYPVNGIQWTTGDASGGSGGLGGTPAQVGFDGGDRM